MKTLIQQPGIYEKELKEFDKSFKIKNIGKDMIQHPDFQISITEKVLRKSEDSKINNKRAKLLRSYLRELKIERNKIDKNKNDIIKREETILKRKIFYFIQDEKSKNYFCYEDKIKNQIELIFNNSEFKNKVSAETFSKISEELAKDVMKELENNYCDYLQFLSTDLINKSFRNFTEFLLSQYLFERLFNSQYIENLYSLLESTDVDLYKELKQKINEYESNKNNLSKFTNHTIYNIDEIIKEICTLHYKIKKEKTYSLENVINDYCEKYKIKLVDSLPKDINPKKQKAMRKEYRKNIQEGKVFNFNYLLNLCKTYELEHKKELIKIQSQDK